MRVCPAKRKNSRGAKKSAFFQSGSVTGEGSAPNGRREKERRRLSLKMSNSVHSRVVKPAGGVLSIGRAVRIKSGE